jgi:hypothetical protein
MKKPPVIRLPKVIAIAQSNDRSWHNGGNIEIYQDALSLQQAARTLVEQLELEIPRSHWADSPIILLYRQALELHLKLLVGVGTNFLKTKVDPISLASTHSLRWLAQITGQIIRKVGWEHTFTCECITSLADFRALVNEVESLETCRTGDSLVQRSKLGLGFISEIRCRAICKAVGLAAGFVGHDG